YGLQNLLGSWLLRTGIYVQLGLALAIGIATRPLHHRVDAFVDDLFFRQRHETERTLRAFARDVSHISDARVVLERTTATVARAARLQCSLFLMTPDGYSRAACSGEVDDRNDVDRNDSAVVRLLATRVPVDLHDVQSGMGGDVAFPMFARNRLLGILSCGGKTDGVTVYAPDELEAIGAVAQAAGLALDLLRIEALERKLEALGSDAAVFTSSIRSSLSEAPSQFVP
ncbi:MAG: GAF domain-containing protein, partial [Candidatus Eremiobacteraeota bacterium]|nr:GAF domain-containing protein [Candidatus Eremiobacteraeota bacterium]